MGLTGDEKALAGACAISLIRGRAVVVGVRENADFPLAISTEFVDSWTGCCCGCEGKC